MKNPSTKIALSLLVALSLGTAHASVRSTIRKSQNLATEQVRGAISAVAQGVDRLMYPALCYLVGSHAYRNHLQQYAPETPQVVTDVEAVVPHGHRINQALLRLVVGCCVVAGAHSALNTNLVGGFIEENMPRLSRLLNFVGAEHGLQKRDRKKAAL